MLILSLNLFIELLRNIQQALVFGTDAPCPVFRRHKLHSKPNGLLKVCGAIRCAHHAQAAGGGTAMSALIFTPRAERTLVSVLRRGSPSLLRAL